MDITTEGNVTIAFLSCTSKTFRLYCGFINENIKQNNEEKNTGEENSKYMQRFHCCLLVLGEKRGGGVEEVINMMVVGEEERFVWCVYITAAAIVRMLKRRALLVLLRVPRFNNCFFIVCLYHVRTLLHILLFLSPLFLSPSLSSFPFSLTLHLSLPLSIYQSLFPSRLPLYPFFSLYLSPYL